MIIRTYVCDECQQEFEVTCESSSPDPDCPTCSTVLQWKPGTFSITGTKSRAIDIAQDILENDYGLTNFKDNTREGETVHMGVQERTAAVKDQEMQTLSEVAQAAGVPITDQQRNMAGVFWGGPAAAGPAAHPLMPTGDQLLAGARAQTAQANAEGVNPMDLLHKAGKAGKLPFKMNIIARA